MAYEIEGRLLEVCTCNVLCPCWVGENPDYETCDTTIAWGIEKGEIEGIDVSGLTIAVSAHIPENILIGPDKPSHVTLLFTFADSSKYAFFTQTENVADDGLDFIDQSGVVLGIRPCFITNDSRQDAAFATRGRFLRCEVRYKAKFDPVKYRVRFHAMDGTPRMLDPTMSSSGGPDTMGGGGRPAAANYKNVPVNVGDPVSLQVVSGVDAYKVIWNAGSGKFNEDDTPMVFKDGNGKIVDIQNCRTAKDADGTMFDETGQYYMCLITTAAPSFSLTYTATYTDSGLRQSKSSTMARP